MGRRSTVAISHRPLNVTPREEDMIARLLTGYGPIWLHSAGDDIVVEIQLPNGVWLEIIRTAIPGTLDGRIDHTIFPAGIRDEIRAAFGEERG